ncbi:MAG: flagellar basal body rod protein FlgB [Thermotogaceae bacterium]|nr:flagellar basal body rod protein FlgB [Thermotogaceae bacterium]
MFNSNFYTLKAAMDVSMLRQEIHAQNLANAETPGYKRRYVVFESILQKVMNEKNVKLNTTNPKHIKLYQTPVKPTVMRDMSTSYRNDGNNVDVDVEVVEMVKNGLKYQVLTRLMSMNIDRYNTVLRGVR